MFNITDGQPTDLNFFLDPLYSMVTNGAEQKLPKPRILVPFWVCYLMSRLFTLLSVLMGKNFALPFWGFTVMETYKVPLKACAFVKNGTGYWYRVPRRLLFLTFLLKNDFTQWLSILLSKIL